MATMQNLVLDRCKGIQDKIKKNLAESILFGDLSSSGGVVTVKVKNNDIVVAFSRARN